MVFMQNFIAYNPDSPRDIRKAIKYLQGLIGEEPPKSASKPKSSYKGPHPNQIPRTPHKPLFVEIPEGDDIEEQLRAALLHHLGPLSNPGTNLARFENISLKEVGELSGTCGATLQRFINRERSLRLDRAARVAHYLKLSLRQDV